MLHWKLYVPAVLIIYKNVVFEELSGEFQEPAPEGTVVDVVVCVPFDHTNSTVSPTFALNELGEKDVPPALTTCFVFDEGGGGVLFVGVSSLLQPIKSIVKKTIIIWYFIFVYLIYMLNIINKLSVLYNIDKSNFSFLLSFILKL